MEKVDINQVIELEKDNSWKMIPLLIHSDDLRVGLKDEKGQIIIVSYGVETNQMVSALKKQYDTIIDLMQQQYGRLSLQIEQKYHAEEYAEITIQNLKKEKFSLNEKVNCLEARIRELEKMNQLVEEENRCYKGDIEKLKEHFNDNTEQLNQKIAQLNQKIGMYKSRPIISSVLDQLAEQNGAIYPEITFGRYMQGINGEIEPIQWIVLDRTGDELLLLSKKILEKKKYSDGWDSEYSWAQCTLRRWLIGTFKNKAFTFDEQKCIKPKKHYRVMDTVFLFNLEEYGKYTSKYYNNSVAICTDYIKMPYQKAIGWWLCSEKVKSTAKYINGAGHYVDKSIREDSGGVRPSIILDLSVNA